MAATKRHSTRVGSRARGFLILAAKWVHYGPVPERLGHTWCESWKGGRP
jgi:hypothetical protein